MKFLAIHITNQKLSFYVFTVGHLQNIFMEHEVILGIFTNFDSCNTFLANATNIPQRLKTGFVVQGHIYCFAVAVYLVFSGNCFLFIKYIFLQRQKNGIIIFVGLCHQQTFGPVCSAYIFHWLQANTGLKTITTTKSLFISIINSYEVETVIFGIAVIGFGFLSLGDSWEKVCETQMELFLSAERRRQISHSASAVRGNFSGLCCLLMKNALYTIRMRRHNVPGAQNYNTAAYCRKVTWGHWLLRKNLMCLHLNITSHETFYLNDWGFLW